MVMLSRFRVIVPLLVLVAACSGDIGVDPEFAGRKPTVRVDTLQLADITTLKLPMYTGAINLETGFIGVRFGAAGSYNDVVFGQTDAVHLMRPRSATSVVMDSIKDGTQVFLELYKESVTGDTVAAQTFNLVEITRNWRGNSWTADSSISANLGATLATFNWTYEDTLRIAMPAEWRDRYKVWSYTADSLNPPQIHGFALVASGNSKIVNIRSEAVKLVFRNTKKVTGTDRDTMIERSTLMRTWATSWAGAAAVIPPNILMADNTFNHLISFDIEATAEVMGSRNLLHAELVWFEDTATLSAGLPSGHKRAHSNYLDIYQLAEKDLTYDLHTVTPSIRATYARGDASFRANLTAVINNQLRANTQDQVRYYLGFKSNIALSSLSKGNDGTIYRTLLNGPNAGARRPILVIKTVIPDA